MKTMKHNGSWRKSLKYVYHKGHIYSINLRLFKCFFLLEDGRMFVESILNPAELLSKVKVNDTVHESVVKHFRENGGYRPHWREES